MKIDHNTYATYATHAMAVGRGKVIAGMIQTAVDSPGNGHKIATSFPEMVVNPLPVVFILNGVATIGKDEFVSSMAQYSGNNGAVSHLSTIDPVRDSVKVLLETMDEFKQFFTNFKSSADIIAEKGDLYRDLLYNVKQSWEKYNHSASTYSVVKVLNDMYYADTSGARRAIFIDSREMDTINTICGTLTGMGIITLKVLIEGDKSTPEDWKNGCDSNVCIDPSKYDIVIHNTGLDDLRCTARRFYAALINGLRTYGISRSGENGDKLFTIKKIY